MVRFTRVDAKTTRISKVVGVIIDIIRNLPLLLIIFFSYFGLPVMGLRVDAFQASVIAMVVFESAMIAEIVRSGIMAVDPGQMEGARSNGMTYMQAMTHVVLPQALTKMIPALLSQFVSLIKDTSLATIIVFARAALPRRNHLQPKHQLHDSNVLGSSGNVLHHLLCLVNFC